jgi:sensitive to high expression protein 9
MAATRQAAREAKTTYNEAVVQRSNSQREVNELLQRKSNWTNRDVNRFPTLLQQEHQYGQEEVRAKAAAAGADDAVDREFSQLSVLIHNFL